MGKRIAIVLVVAAGLHAQVSFNRDIRPIMSDTCFRCHGPDKNARMAGLRLDIRDEALKTTMTGITPIVPGDPDRSAIVQRVFATDARIMPPAHAHKELTQAQKETIRRWVAEGAKYEPHWAYIPLTSPAAPSGAKHPIDAFIAARLAREGLKPSPEADRPTLIRRVTLDLTGLPPTPAEIDAFLKDTSATAYEKVVDRLLASPRYAEKQAMHWLDAVRYADTSGFHGDNPFPVWPYRDYVLRSFRDNKPFDQFTREQLAGDLLPNATTEQKIASAYNRLTRTSAEGGLQPKEYVAKYGSDRVRTASAVWLGSTLGCAECHDHKFDPFTARDFYAMKAFFADILETGLVPDRASRAFGAKLELPTDEQQRRRERLHWQLSEARRNLEAEAQALLSIEEERKKWENDLLRRYDAAELKWQYQRPVSASAANGAELAIYNDQPVDSSYYFGITLMSKPTPGNGLVVASGPNPDNETYTVAFRPGTGSWTALGIEVQQDEGLPGQRVARGADRLVLTEVDAELSGRKLPFAFASSNIVFQSPEYHAMATIDGDSRTGWGTAWYGDNSNLFLALRFSGKVATTSDSVITVRLRHDSEIRRATLGRFRVALSRGEHSWPEAESVRSRLRPTKPEPESHLPGLPDVVVRGLKTPDGKRTDAQRKAILEYFQFATPDLQPLLAAAAKLEAEFNGLEAEIPRVVATKATMPRETRILPRGNWMDESGQIVEPAVPAFLGKLNVAGRRATRLDLANWMVSRDNPLPARVFVNRIWRQFFGAGLSRVLDDVGSQGEWPTHLELLDWLAAEFSRSWDVRHTIRTIVTSHTYRQSSLSRPELDQRDPDNRLLARQSRFRVDAEIVRDIALAASGLLVEKFGGPSVKPYQPEGYLAALNFPKRDYSASRGDDLYRRGVYTFWQRTFLHPSMVIFDAPTREECTVNRTSSNTPLQALILLNDPIYVEAARVFAQNMVKDGGRTLNERIDWAFQRATSRKPTVEERNALAELHRKSFAEFQAASGEAGALLHVGDAPVLESAKPAELAALTTVARAILNLHETVTRN
ncbi:MAG: PSD1 and planctomycete cytochrome C domain-containing protein [Bryobacteraceae bacterium]